jgi:hypothetical protein
MYYHQTDLRATLEPAIHHYFDPSRLSSASAFVTLVKSLQDPAIFIMPKLLSCFICTIDRHKHSLYNQSSSSSKSSHDIFIAEQLGKTTAQALDFALVSVGQSDGVHAWKCRSLLWETIAQWGGYVEGDARWTGLLDTTARQAEVALQQIEHRQPILQTLATLEQLDHRTAAVGADTVSLALAVSLATLYSAYDRRRHPFVRRPPSSCPRISTTSSWHMRM